VLRKALTTSLSAVVLTVLLVVIVVTMSTLSANFLSVPNLLSALALAAPLGIIAIGMTFVVLIGGIDLSVGAVLALSAVTVGLACSVGVPVGAAAALGLIVGALCGLLNGVLVARLGLPSIVVTLATMSVYGGLALAFSGGSSYPIPSEFAFLGQGLVAGIPMPLVCLLVLFAVAYVALTRTTYGDKMYALGTNPTAMRFAAQKAGRLSLSAYVISGLLSAVAALIFCSMVSSAKANFGTGYELAAVTIVVVGGAALTGGKGTLWGTLLATVVIAFLQNGFSIAFIASEVQTMFIGGALILTAATYRWLPRLVAARPAGTTSAPPTSTHTTPTTESTQ
jgi:ribose/xylose/arabinose/galactoside ABC-type transport system permease subunit